jgi:DNA alkylation repair enzyme
VGRSERSFRFGDPLRLVPVLDGQFSRFLQPGALPRGNCPEINAGSDVTVLELWRHRVGELLRLYPAETHVTLRKWAKLDDMWKRRSAILAQLGFNADTDLALLYACIQPSIREKKFFLRKAIGWALRQFAKTDAKEVRRYVAEHEAQLSPLSKREALKNLV